MNILVDTNIFLWFCSGDGRLRPSHRELIEDGANVLFFSSVSAAEIAIKCGIGKLTLPAPPRTYVPELRRRHQFAELPLDESASLLIDTLPDIHRDPFDRLLICQALAHDLPFLTSDSKIQLYPGIQLL